MRARGWHRRWGGVVALMLLVTLSLSPAASIAAAVNCCASPCAATHLEAPGPAGCRASAGCVAASPCGAVSPAFLPAPAAIAATPIVCLLPAPGSPPTAGVANGRPPTPPPNG